MREMIARLVRLWFAETHADQWIFWFDGSFLCKSCLFYEQPHAASQVSLMVNYALTPRSSTARSISNLLFDASQTPIAQGDWHAFRFWAQNSEDDKQIEQDFCRRFIGQNRKRLAQAINFLYPKGTTWSEDPRPIVDVLFPISELKIFTEALSIEEALDSVESEGIKRFEKLLQGKWFDIQSRIYASEDETAP
jgi:hypothetical protein